MYQSGEDFVAPVEPGVDGLAKRQLRTDYRPPSTFDRLASVEQLVPPFLLGVRQVPQLQPRRGPPVRLVRAVRSLRHHARTVSAVRLAGNEAARLMQSIHKLGTEQ